MSKYVLIAAASLLLLGCQQQRIDGTNFESFQHSIRTICKSSPTDVQCDIFQLQVQTASLRKGPTEVRMALDGMTYSEAQMKIKEFLPK